MGDRQLLESIYINTKTLLSMYLDIFDSETLSEIPSGIFDCSLASVRFE